MKWFGDIPFGKGRNSGIWRIFGISVEDGVYGILHAKRYVDVCMYVYVVPWCNKDKSKLKLAASICET